MIPFQVLSPKSIYQLNNHTRRLCAIVSEEREDIIPIPSDHPKGKYILVYNPLDGSSSIDTNISIGTIFGVYQTLDFDKRGRLKDCLQSGRNLIAACYILYGTSTMLVYSTGEVVHGFTLDPAWGESILSDENMRFPDPPQFFSFNHTITNRLPAYINQYIQWLLTMEKPKLTHRYVGSMVADFHRNMLHGGVFGYPAEATKPDSKIRLL